MAFVFGAAVRPPNGAACALRSYGGAECRVRRELACTARFSARRTLVRMRAGPATPSGHASHAAAEMGEDSEEDGFESDDIGWEQQFPQDDADFEAFVARQQELDKQYADIESRRKAAILSDEIDSERQQDGVEGDGSARSAPVALKRKRRPKLPVVVIIGRPNVGKSQLMNRIAGDFKAGSIVQDVVGITRDRTYRPAFWAQYEFSLVDTGGLIFDDDPTQAFIAEIRQQALIALEECKAAILVVDGQAGLNPLDEQIASFLRKEAGHVPVTVAVNKCESDMGTSYAADFWSLGLGEPFPVSALHGTGTGDLLDNVVKALPVVNTDLIQNESLGPNEEWLQEISVAIVGKPNAGKSSILNKLLGKERAIVSTIAGTTRDTVDDVVIRDHAEYRLLDTAGIRRKKNIKYGTEFFMINRAFKSIRRSDVALLVIDVMDGVTEQDRKIAERIIAEGRACIIVVNKWDLYEDKTDKSFTKVQEQIRDDLPMLKWAPITLVSALTGKRIPSLLQMVDEVYAQYRRRVSTAVLNEALEELVDWHKPPSTATAKQGKVYFCTQVASAPPTIAMFVNSTKLFSDNYKRYTDSKFRSILGFEGTPLRILWRTKT